MFFSYLGIHLCLDFSQGVTLALVEALCLVDPTKAMLHHLKVSNLVTLQAAHTMGSLQQGCYMFSPCPCLTRLTSFRSGSDCLLLGLGHILDSLSVTFFISVTKLHDKSNLRENLF